jgi:hypothetical protein
MATIIDTASSAPVVTSNDEVDLEIMDDSDDVTYESMYDYLNEFVNADNQPLIVDGNIVRHKIDTLNLYKLFIDLFHDIYQINNDYVVNYVPFKVARKMFVNIHNDESITKNPCSGEPKTLIARLPILTSTFNHPYTDYTDALSKVALFKNHPTQDIDYAMNINCIGFAEQIKMILDFIKTQKDDSKMIIVSSYYKFFMELNNFIVVEPDKKQSAQPSSHPSEQDIHIHTPTKSSGNQCHGLTKSTKKQCKKPSSADCFTSDGHPSCKKHAGTASAPDACNHSEDDAVSSEHSDKHVSVSKSTTSTSSPSKNPCYGTKKDGKPCSVSANKSGNYMTSEYEGKSYPTCHHHSGSQVNIALLNGQISSPSLAASASASASASDQPVATAQKNVIDSKKCHGLTGKKTPCSKSSSAGNQTEDGYPACYQHNGKKSCI